MKRLIAIGLFVNAVLLTGILGILLTKDVETRHDNQWQANHGNRWVNRQGLCRAAHLLLVCDRSLTATALLSA